METAIISAITYLTIELISLAILLMYKEKFIMAARILFTRLDIAPVVHNHNTYYQAQPEEESEKDNLHRLSDYMGGENINYGWDLSEEKEDENE
jgi:hypothetical protein